MSQKCENGAIYGLLHLEVKTVVGKPSGIAAEPRAICIHYASAGRPAACSPFRTTY